METNKFDYPLKGLIKDNENIAFNEIESKYLQFEKILNELVVNPYFQRRLEDKGSFKNKLLMYVNKNILESTSLIKLKYLLSKLILDLNIVIDDYKQFSDGMRESIIDFSKIEFNYYFEETLLEKFLLNDESESSSNKEKFYYSLKELNLNKIKKYLRIFLEYIARNISNPSNELRDLFNKLVEKNKDHFSSLKEIFAKFLKIENLDFKNLVLENLADLYFLKSKNESFSIEVHIENIQEAIKIYKIISLETKENNAKIELIKLFNLINLSIKKFEKEYISSSLNLRHSVVVNYFSNSTIQIDTKIGEIGKYLIFLKKHNNGEIVFIIPPTVGFDTIKKISNNDRQNIFLTEVILNTDLNTENINDLKSYKLLKNKKIIYEYYINNNVSLIFEGLNKDTNFNENNLLKYLELFFNKYLNDLELKDIDLSQLFNSYFNKEYDTFVNNLSSVLKYLIKIDEIKSNLNDDLLVYFEFILFERPPNLENLNKEGIVLFHLLLMIFNSAK